MSFIPYGRQWIDEDDINSVVEVLKGDWLTGGPKIDEFEELLADNCGAKYAVACSSGTSALHLTQLALGSNQNTYAVTTPNTFLATANCVRYVGGRVAFADVMPDTANIDPVEVERKLKVAPEGAVKGVIPVHFGGNPAEIEKIKEVADRHSAWVVEDACHAIGAKYKTKSGEEIAVGSCRHSDMTVFSFHPVKHIAMGEGGAVTTNNEELYRKLLQFRNHGMEKGNDPEKPWMYIMTELGYNYRLTDMQAALGISQLGKLDNFVKRRRDIAESYREFFTDYSEYCMPLEESDGGFSSYHLFVVLFDFKKIGLSRGDIMGRLRAADIGTQVHYIPVHTQPYYKNEGGSKIALPVVEKYYEQALSIPMYPLMTDSDVERVKSAIKNIFEDAKA